MKEIQETYVAGDIMFAAFNQLTKGNIRTLTIYKYPFIDECGNMEKVNYTMTYSEEDQESDAYTVVNCVVNGDSTIGKIRVSTNKCTITPLIDDNEASFMYISKDSDIIHIFCNKIEYKLYPCKVEHDRCIRKEYVLIDKEGESPSSSSTTVNELDVSKSYYFEDVTEPIILDYKNNDIDGETINLYKYVDNSDKKLSTITFLFLILVWLIGIAGTLVLSVTLITGIISLFH